MVAILWSRVRPAMPWWLLAIGIALMGTGDIIWDILAASGEVSEPSWADPVYLSGMMAIVLAAVLLLLRKGARISSLLDAIIVSAAFATLLWTLLVEPQVDTATVSVLQLATVAAYPALDLVMLSTLVVALHEWPAYRPRDQRIRRSGPRLPRERPGVRGRIAIGRVPSGRPGRRVAAGLRPVRQPRHSR